MGFAAMIPGVLGGSTALGAGAGGATAGAGIGGAVLSNPILKAILVDLGAQAATELLGSVFGGQTPAEQGALMATQAGQQLIPQLQAQALGQPTAATQAQMGQLQQASTRMGQSYAASARGRGMGAPTLGGGQPTVSRAQQGRYQAAQLQGMANIMGQSQIAAQQQLGGIYQQGLGMQRQMEMQEAAARGQAVSNIMKMYQNIEDMKARQEHDAALMDLYNKLLAAVQANL